MLRSVIGLWFLVCLAQAAPTVHLDNQNDEYADLTTPLPLIVDPIYVTAKPIVDTSYVSPVTNNHIPPYTTSGQPPVQYQPQSQPHPQPQPYPQPQQPQFHYYYYQPSEMYHPYNSPTYHTLPSHGFQWQARVPQQNPIIQPSPINVLPCSNPRHYGGYQQYGY